MSVKLIAVEGDTVRMELNIKLSRSMLESEETILNALNEAGCRATGEALKRFDTDGSAIVIGGMKWTSKGEEPKYYQTPYGEVEVLRHVYQTSAGGKTYCPLERDARIVVTSTPRFAKVVSHKFGCGGSTQVESDLAENHGRRVARSYLQNLAEAVGSIVQAKEETWHYATPRLTVPVHTVAIGLEGTCMLLCEEGYRQAMVGRISLYDQQGERLHTMYVGATPRVWTSDLYGADGAGDRSCEAPLSEGSLCGDRRWGAEQLGFLKTAYPYSDPRFLSCRGLSGRGGPSRLSPQFAQAR
jgi:hypothetical protein